MKREFRSLILPSDRTETSHIKKLKSQPERKRKREEGRGGEGGALGLNADFRRLNSTISAGVLL